MILVHIDDIVYVGFCERFWEQL